MSGIRYYPEFFNQRTVDDAKSVILTAGGGLDVEQRWKVETDWLKQRIGIQDGGVVVDYGCGIGRVAKMLDRPVLGVDLSIIMLQYAVEYVGRKDFVAASPIAFRELVHSGFRASGAVAIWSLQHVADLYETVEVLMTGLQAGAPLYVLDLFERHVPGMQGDEFVMVNDGRDLSQALEPWCELERKTVLDVWPEHMDNPGTLCKFRRRG